MIAVLGAFFFLSFFFFFLTLTETQSDVFHLHHSPGSVFHLFNMFSIFMHLLHKTVSLSEMRGRKKEIVTLWQLPACTEPYEEGTQSVG